MIGYRGSAIRVEGWGGNGVPTLDQSAFDFIAISATLHPRALAGSTTRITSRDAVFDRTITSTSFSDYQLAAIYVGSLPEPAVWVSSNPSVATVSSTGFVTHVAQGNATISATIGTITRSLTIRFGSQVQVDTFVNYEPMSFSQHCVTAIDGRIATKSATTAKAVYSTQNHTTATYVRNPNVWCADLVQHLTCISPWNSTGGSTRAGVAISDRFILFAVHYPIGNGATIRFVTADNIVVTRTMVTSRPISGSYDFLRNGDLMIGMLDSPLPASITPCRILPADWGRFMPHLWESNPYGANPFLLPCLVLDQEENALVSNVRRMRLNVMCDPPTSAKRLEFFESIIGGDSGNPFFLVTEQALILLTVATSGGAGSGTAVHLNYDLIRSNMIQLGGTNSANSFPAPFPSGGFDVHEYVS